MNRFRLFSSRVMMFALTGFVSQTLIAEDWSRFRGPGGRGVANESKALPTQWSPTANLAWKTPLPGPGVSSPIIVGDKVFVTCYSGYGLDQADPGDINQLVRHLVCADVRTGKVIWQKDVPATLPEDPYSGIGVTAHGYASHTPVSDGETVYAFFGKSGVHAYDLDGNERWQTGVGQESDPTRWGSSSSPILFGDTVIVTASAESQSIVGLDRATGKELWRQEAQGLDGMWGTPTLLSVGEGRTDLVMCVAREMWGLDPASGALRWYADATDAQGAYSSVITEGDTVYAFTGRGGGSVAIKAGGKGDVSDSHTIWTGTEMASFASPVGHGTKLYVIARNVLTVVDRQTGEKLSQLRLRGVKQTGGRFGSLDYPSPVVVGDTMYHVNGAGQTFVFDLSGDTPEQVAVNVVTEDKETFGGSPAVSDGRMVLRSSKHLYGIADRGDAVEPSERSVAVADEPAAGDSGRRGGPGGGGRSYGGRPGGDRPGAGGRGGNWDPMSIFKQRDQNQDGQLTADEVAGSRLADRMEMLDKDGNQAVSEEEFRTGMARLFGGGRGGRGGAGGGRGEGGRPGDSRPERPQRPTMAP